MGAEMVERWVEEIVQKLSKKVAGSLAEGKGVEANGGRGELIKKLMKPEEKEEDMGKKKKEKKKTCTNSLSESTLCLLLDRFAS